jgi:regulation of enolase protein 1 (concanavalin A-like superfamily)
MEYLEIRQLLSGTWTALTNPAPGQVGTMELLPNGSVLATIDGDGAGNNWGILTPNSSGSYVSGTWSHAANANDTRLFDSTDVLQDGSVFVAGGEDGNGDGTAEVYNPITNTWTLCPSQPYGNFADAFSTLIPNGDVLITPVSPDITAGTTLYNPSTNTWSQGPTLPYSFDADEQGGVTLPDHSVLTVYNNKSERYIPAENKWITDAALPASESDSLGEYGVDTLLPNGNALFIGSGGNSAIYTPSGSTAPGTWVAGPSIPGGLGEDDASGAMLRDGTFLVTAGPSASYGGPTSFYDYDPSTNAFTAVAGPDADSQAPFLTRMLALPNGDVLYSENGTTVWQYDPGTTALAAAAPSITSVVANGNGSLTLTGTNLNGLNAGAVYGDDAQMDTNYPLIRLTLGSKVYYATASSWSNTGVMLGSTSETVNFTLPLGIPSGTYSLVAVANGVPSTATSLTISDDGETTHPTVATPAAISPSTVAGTTATLSVLGADANGAAGLTYTWVNTSAPSGGQLASFSINGTNAAQNTTAIFHEIGTYSFDCVITNAGGLSVTSSSVSVVVNQTFTSATVTPATDNISAGQTETLTATGYDQFGNPMATQPAFTWSLSSGAGTVSPAGIYTAPATGTLATVKAASGSVSASGSVYVVNIPWTAADIGNLGIPGTVYDSAGVTTLSEASDDIWNQADDFLFDYQELAGNVTITAELDSQTSASNYIKAGLMIRNSLSSDDAMAMVCDPAPGPLFEWRTAANTNAAQDATSASSNPPYWLQLVRNGNLFTAYSSPNDSTWTEIGSQTITMGTNVYVGLALSSHDGSELATAKFSNVSVVSSQTLTSIKLLTAPVNLTAGQSEQLIAEGFDQNGFAMSSQPAFTYTLNSGSGTLSSSGFFTAPSTGTLATFNVSSGGLSTTGTIGVVNPPWTSTDIGTLGTPGVAYDSTGTTTTTTITDASDDIWNTSDDFHFDYQTLTGNGTITAELDSQTTTGGNFTKAGLMIRNSLSPSDAMAMVFDAPNGIPFEWRTSDGAAATQGTASTNYGSPYWFRLTRNGSTISAYSSANGFIWAPLGSQVIPMNPTVFVGLALSSHNASVPATAVFSNVSISNPTVATAAAATPNPVTGKTAALSVMGANTPSSTGESSLTYTWAATAVPTGATTPAFSINGTNAAKNTTATFTRAGTYGFTVTIADSLGNSVTSSVTVTVNQTLTTITVSPATASLNENATQTFTATGYDQFGIALANQPTFTWAKTSGVGSVNSSTGVFSAPAVTGSSSITATNGTIVGSATVTVSDAAPTVTSAAAASPSPVTGTTTALSVGASSDAGASSLIFTWAATTIPTGATAPAFSPNGTNAANNSTATFSKPGTYTFTVTISDGQGQTATSSVTVIVSQTLTSVALSSSTVVAGATTQATADDQFGNAMAAQWNATGGSINASGLFTAGATGGSFTVTATSGGTSLSTAVTVIPTAYTGAHGSDTYAIRLSPTNTALEQIFVNTPETGTPTYTVAMNQLPELSFTTASDGSVTVDFANGNPLPPAGINFTSGNALVIAGNANGGMAFSIGAGQVIDAAAPASPIDFSGVASVNFNLVGGSNLLTQTAQPSAVVTYNAGPLSNTLNISGGTFTISADPQATSGSLTVNDNAAVVFTAPVPGSGYNARNLAALNLGANASATVAASTTATDRTVLVTPELSIATGATLDLTNNAMIVQNGNLPAITALLASGQNARGGYWNGTGITSSTAAGDTTDLTTLGAISNNFLGSPLNTTFDNQPVSLNDVLIKFTYYGDTDLNGQVDGSDYSRIDSAFLTSATGWFNGDFNYDQTIDGSDYTLIDNAFNRQGTTLSAQLAKPASAVATPRAMSGSEQKASATVDSATTAIPIPAQSVFATRAFATPAFATRGLIQLSPLQPEDVELFLQKKDLLDALASS